MLSQILALQSALGITDAQLLHLARTVAGARVRGLGDMLSVELFELLDELQRIAIDEQIRAA